MKGQPWTGGHPEMLVGCSHGEEAPRDQPWHCQGCQQHQQLRVWPLGKGQRAGKGLEEMPSGVSWVMPLSLQALGTS